VERLKVVARRRIEERSFVAKDAPLDDGQVRGVVRVTFAAEPDRKKRG
jgi:hypothetical protein